jgi:hypothetical protein
MGIEPKRRMQFRPCFLQVIKNARRGDVDDTKLAEVCFVGRREADGTAWEASVGVHRE